MRVAVDGRRVETHEPQQLARAAHRGVVRFAEREPQFRGRDGETGTCVFGEDHAASATAAWHEIGPGHGVSCRFWPPGIAPSPARPMV